MLTCGNIIVHKPLPRATSRYICDVHGHVCIAHAFLHLYWPKEPAGQSELLQQLSQQLEDLELDARGLDCVADKCQGEQVMSNCPPEGVLLMTHFIDSRLQ